ncbi:hypothetical protein M8494_05990 [Serratia ureilytica]
MASQPSQDASVWSGLLLAHLSRFKRYPATAVRQQRQGCSGCRDVGSAGERAGCETIAIEWGFFARPGGASVTAARFSTARARQRDRSGAGGIQREHSDSFRSA